jgi:uncharacterized protein YbaR (Trm112 family)
MSLDERLLDILVCPIDKGPLLYFPEDAALYNPRLRRLHRVEAGVPLLRADDSQVVEPKDHQEFIAKAAAGEARGTQGTPAADLLAVNLEPRPESTRGSRRTTISPWTAPV